MTERVIALVDAGRRKPLPPVSGSAAGLARDRLGRAPRDLRISVTDRCNFRCTYCMPREVFGEDYRFLPHEQLLSFEEIAGIGVYEDKKEKALRELERCADQLGMVGLIILANVNDVLLDDARFEPVWAELNRRQLPVLLHPTVPPGFDAMGMDKYGLIASLGFMVDTTLAVTRMVLAGVFERYPDWPLIVGHAGATLPFIAGRLDQCHRFIPDTRQFTSKPPSHYLKRLYYDTVTYDVEALHLAYKLAGPERLLYGSDYPHNIGDMPGCAQRVTALPIPEAEKELIRSGNAKRLFRL